MPDSSQDGSFETVVLPHLGAAYNLARWLLRDPATAEDVVQEAVLRALTYFGGFKGVNPRAWLLQIVRNVAHGSRGLDRGVEMLTIGDDGTAGSQPIASDADDPERALIRSRDERLVAELIASLPLELREALVLRELEELSYREIAQVTGAPIGTVMSRLYRARYMLTRLAAGREAVR